MITVCAVKPMAILAGSGSTPGGFSGPDDVTSGDGEDAWE